MGRRKKPKTAAKRGARKKSDTDQNSNETLEESGVNKTNECNSPVVEENQLSSTMSGCPSNEKSHKKFIKIRYFGGYTQDEETQGKVDNAFSGGVDFSEEFNKDEDVQGDTCLQGEIGHEEVIEDTSFNENLIECVEAKVSCEEEEDVTEVVKTVEIFNEESSTNSNEIETNKTESIVEGIQAMNVQEPTEVVELPPPVLLAEPEISTSPVKTIDISLVKPIESVPPPKLVEEMVLLPLKPIETVSAPQAEMVVLPSLPLPPSPSPMEIVTSPQKPVEMVPPPKSMVSTSATSIEVVQPPPLTSVEMVSPPPPLKLIDTIPVDRIPPLVPIGIPLALPPNKPLEIIPSFTTKTSIENILLPQPPSTPIEICTSQKTVDFIPPPKSEEYDVAIKPTLGIEDIFDFDKPINNKEMEKIMCIPPPPDLIDAPEILTVHKSENVKCYPVRKPPTKSELSSPIKTELASPVKSGHDSPINLDLSSPTKSDLIGFNKSELISPTKSEDSVKLELASPAKSDMSPIKSEYTSPVPKGEPTVAETSLPIVSSILPSTVKSTSVMEPMKQDDAEMVDIKEVAAISAKSDKINNTILNGEDIKSIRMNPVVILNSLPKSEIDSKLRIDNNTIQTKVSKEKADDYNKCTKSKTENNEQPTTFVRRRSSRIKVNRWSDALPELKSTAVTTTTPTTPGGEINQEPPTAAFLPPAPSFETDKPVKVKSRWRRTSELEMGTNVFSAADTETNKFSTNLSGGSGPVDVPVRLPLNQYDPEVEERLKTFQIIVQNVFLTVRTRSKEAKRMICDCTLSKEEIARGEPGCGDDCLNRLLMIECGSRCVLGDLCSNKRFQNCQYAKCEVVKTPKKGLGLVASVNIPSGEFLMEYVGEVLDAKEFRRRAKEYAKEKNKHYYFMALKSDNVIDATTKGNVSRFINHSCDPNAETQKWTVNGELRIGFFSKRSIAQGEEITFDYQLQRYGKEAQRCYCDSRNCRGWIGEDPEKDKDRDKNWSKKERKEKKRKEEKRKDLREVDLEEEIEKLSTTGVKNRAHTLLLSRLMVRAEDRPTRLQLLNFAQNAAAPCRQLFLDYHGLTLLWSWMIDVRSTNKVKLEILKTLEALPITNKTIIRDSKVLSVVEKWAKKSSDSPNERKERSGDDEEGGSTESGDSPTNNDAGKTEEESKDSGNSETAAMEVDHEQEKDEHSEQEVVDSASALLAKWADLKEDFRIPKKERVEQMKEHEREADRGYYSDPRENLSYDRHWSHDKDGGRHHSSNNGGKERRRGRESPDYDWSRKSRDDSRHSRMSKMQRRQLFALKVEEEDRHRKHVEKLWAKHQEQCVALGVDPNRSPMFNNNYPPYFPPLPPHVHDSILDGEGRDVYNMMRGPPLPPGTRYRPPRGPPGPPPPIGSICPPPHQFPSSGGPPPPFIDQPQFQRVAGPPPPHQFTQPPPQVFPSGPPPPLPPPGQFAQQPQPQATSFPFPPSNPPGIVVPAIPGQPITSPTVQQPPPSQTQVIQNATMSSSIIVTPTNTAPITTTTAPPPPPPPTTILLPFKLPPKWKPARDKEGRIYYYHIKTRKSQWQIPVAKRTVKAAQVSDSDSDSSDSSDDDTSSSEDDEDKDDDEDDEVDYDDLLLFEAKRKVKLGTTKSTALTTAAVATTNADEVQQSEAHEIVQEPVLKKRREGLVQVNIISPRDDDADYRKGVKKSKIRETKEKLLKQKLVRLKRNRNRDVAKSCEADTSSGPSRRIKDLFRIQMANEVVACLNPYRKQDCKVARITNTEDFKHLARKLTHFVMVKELKHCSSIEELACNDNVKHKARDFIRKYMNKFGPTYTRSPDD